MPAISADFGLADGTAGLLVTVTQVCFALGIIFIVPRADLVDRRLLVSRLMVLCCLGLLAATLSPTAAVLAVSLGVVATASVVGQILVPFASTLAAEGERGRVVGFVLSGAFTGILLARTVSGFLAGLAGWRAPFLVAAVAIAVLAFAVWRFLPVVPRAETISYPRLLASVLALVRSEPVLRHRMLLGGCGYAGFAMLWTTISFLLAAPPFNFGEGEIGLFGLAGLAGALAASRAGRLDDIGYGRQATGAALLLILVGWVLLGLGESTIPLIVAGLVVFDLGVQGQNVLSQGAIYALGRDTASRVNTAYVTACFGGGAVGSAIGAFAWTHGGWWLVCCCGAAFALAALGVWLWDFRAPR